MKFFSDIDSNRPVYIPAIGPKFSYLSSTICMPNTIPKSAISSD